MNGIRIKLDPELSKTIHFHIKASTLLMHLDLKTSLMSYALVIDVQQKSEL